LQLYYLALLPIIHLFCFEKALAFCVVANIFNLIFFVSKLAFSSFFVVSLFALKK
jgi:hypothetical protein